jgi:Lar family restriction alleviation protein
MKKHLKPCPFCGNEDPETMETPQLEWTVYCGSCRARGPVVGTQVYACDQWNEQIAGRQIASALKAFKKVMAEDWPDAAKSGAYTVARHLETA